MGDWHSQKPVSFTIIELHVEGFLRLALMCCNHGKIHIELASNEITKWIARNARIFFFSFVVLFTTYMELRC